MKQFEHIDHLLSTVYDLVVIILMAELSVWQLCLHCDWMRAVFGMIVLE